MALSYDSALFIPDLHALTSVKNAELMRRQSQTLAMTYFALLGLDTSVTVFRQSDIYQLPKLNWILANFTPYSLMLRAHSFKDAQAKNSDINMGVFTYPILMAADILGYDIDVVPVGKDQVQHLEMARDIARSVNTTFDAEILKEPVAAVRENVAVLPGTDGRKMSKSYDNFIGVFDTPDQIKKRVMSMTTDSTPVEAPKNPDTCNVFSLIQVVAEPAITEEIRQKYLAGGYGYGHAKMALTDILVEYLRPYRETKTLLDQDPETIEALLKKGAIEMNARLDTVMSRLSGYLGI